MRSASALVACAIVLGAWQLRPSAMQSEANGPDRGVIAVLRRDGLMLPFAAFRGTRWQLPWPNSLDGLELPVNLASIPERWWGGEAPESWQAWLIGGTPRSLTPTAPQIFPIHCAPRLGLRTDYKSASDVPRMQVEPYPKDGIAATAGVQIEPLETVSEDAPGRSRLAVALLETFNRAEDREISMLSSVFRHPWPRDKRQKLPVNIETWYRTTFEDGGSVSYIEAARRYPPGPDDKGCGLETVFSGWVTQEAGERELDAELQGRVTFCDRIGATYMQPFGRIRLRDRVYWIAQIAGPEAEWYVVADVEPGRVRHVVEYFAGSRESCVQR